MELHLPYNAKYELQTRWFVLLFLFSVLSFAAFSQTSNLAAANIIEQFRSLAQRSPSELAYIQTSKGIYEPGEDLWFKVSLLDAHRFSPSRLSNTLYLQVINENTNQAFWQEKYEIKNGFVDGHVFLPDSLSEGDYLLAAYTQHSFFNDSSELKSIRRIKVKKDMSPRSSFTADFNQSLYRRNDSIRVKITALSAERKPLYAEIEASLMGGKKTLGQARATTNEQGQATLVFEPQSKGEGLRVETVIKCGNREESLRFQVPCKRGSPIQFDTFPEGGNLVAGLLSKLAFKAVDIDGMPIDIKGTLFEDNTPLLEFGSLHDGMGSLDFMPLAGKKYHIRLSEPAQDSTFLLPEVNLEGIILGLTKRDKETLEFTVQQSPGLKEEPVYLRAQIRGMVYCMATGILDKELKIEIPLEKFPYQGITEFTLYNASLIPVAERLVYVAPDKKLYIEALPDKKKYETREKVTLKIMVKDENGTPVVANLGVNVYDKLYQNKQDPENIQTHYYLSTQLKGKIYDPAFYFDNKNEQREEAMDLLLLTQGWRRYVWSEPVLKEYGNSREPIVFDGVKGSFNTTKRRKKTQSPLHRVKIFDTEKNENTNNWLESDSTGVFTVSPGHLKFWQGGFVYLKPLGLSSNITMTDPFQTINQTMKTKGIINPLANRPDTAKEEPVRPYIIGPNVIELDEVTIKGQTINPFRDKYMGHLDSLAKLNLCSDYVGEICHIINCPACGNSNMKPIEGKRYTKWVGDRRPGPHPYWYKGSEMETLIYHYPNYTEEELLIMNNLWRIKAYYAERQFYQPNYDKETADNFVPDSRNTLAWAPSVITDEKGEAFLEFFCSDVNTGFVGKVEGVSSGGLLGTKDFEFTVQKTKPFEWEK